MQAANDEKNQRGKTEQIWLCLNPDQMWVIRADIPLLWFYFTIYHRLLIDMQREALNRT